MNRLLPSLSLYRSSDGAAARAMRLLMLASVFVFATHNLEELLGIESWARTRFSGASYYRFDRFLAATGLLTVAYAIVVVRAVWGWRPTGTLLMLLGFSAIIANGVVHIVSRFVFASRFPGWITAVCLILPMGAVVFSRFVRDGLLLWWQPPFFIAAGLVLQGPLAWLALNAARLFL